MGFDWRNDGRVLVDKKFSKIARGEVPAERE